MADESDSSQPVVEAEATRVVFETRPLTQAENVLLDKYKEAVAEQSALMDKLGQQLITLELAIPGLYATVLKLRQGDEATVVGDGWFYLAVFFWLLALGLAVRSIVPRDYKVNTQKLKSDPKGTKGREVSIEGFFRESALFKRRFLVCSIFCFALSIICAALVSTA